LTEQKVGTELEKIDETICYPGPLRLDGLGVRLPVCGRLLVKGVVDGEQTEQEDWLMEMTSPGNLVRAGGWSRNAVKAGDRVVVDFSPLRDTSSRGGALKKVTLVETGQSFTANLRAQEMPGLE
jgi:hypothetical protein